MSGDPKAALIPARVKAREIRAGDYLYENGYVALVDFVRPPDTEHCSRCRDDGSYEPVETAGGMRGGRQGFSFESDAEVVVYRPLDRDVLVEAARDVAATARRYVLPIIGSDVTHATFEALLDRLDAALGEGDKA